MAQFVIESRKSKIENLQAAIEFIQSLDQIGTPQHSRDYHFLDGIARARHLLHRLGGAPRITTRCVLIAGSKGKGSTAAMLSSVLASAGYSVGLFTGPHLHTPLERFAIRFTTEGTEHTEKGRERNVCSSGLGDLRDLCGFTLIAEDSFVDLVRRIYDIVAAWDRDDLGLPTRFEAFTAMAYRWFEEQAVNIAVMEIGIGGRLDAVNLAEPMLSVITNISLEHTQMLGNTLTEIAHEKAGIMRAGRPVVIAQQAPEAEQTLRTEAARMGALPVLAEGMWHCEPLRHQIEPDCSGQWFTVANSLSDDIQSFFVPLLGAYQLQNAAAVLAACEALGHMGMPVAPTAMRAGLANTHWLGRFELLGFKPIVIADGAHTPYSIQQLCASLREYFGQQRIHFIVGILRDKDSHGMLAAIARDAASVTLCDMPVRRAISATQLLEQWRELQLPGAPSLAADLREALSRVRAIASPDAVICVTGSLHLVAEAEEIIGNS